MTTTQELRPRADLSWVQVDLDVSDRATASTRSQVARVVLVALVALSAFVGLRLALHDGDVSTFVLAGDQVTRPEEAPGNLHVEPGVRGYDGQAFYRLARNPFTRASREFGVEFSRPEYRHQRVGYPAVAWLLAGGGREGLTPWALVVVNLAAGAAIAGLAARLALDAGRSPWLGLVPAAWAGYLVGLSLDLSEVTAGALLLASILALRRSRWLVATATLTAGVLTRETMLLLVAAVLATALYAPLRHRLAADAPGPAGIGGRVPVWVALVPMGTYGAWRVLLNRWWEGVPTTQGSGDFLTVPLVRLGQRLWAIAADPSSLDASSLQLVLTLVVVALAVASLADRGAGTTHERLALAAFALLFACSPVWNLDVTFLRWANDSVTLGWLLALSAGRDRLRAMVAATGALWLLTASLWVRFP